MRVTVVIMCVCQSCYIPRSNWHGLTVVLLFFSVLTFGFEPVVYDVRESVGTVNLGIFVYKW